MRNLRIHFHLSSQTSFLFYFDGELNNSSSKSYIEDHYIRTPRIHQSYINTRITLLVRESAQNSVRPPNKSVSLSCSLDELNI